MVSSTAMGVALFTIPFTVIALHSLREYLKDKRDPKKKHIFYAFMFLSISFILDLIGALMLSPDMSPTKGFIVNALLKIFDFINMIGVFWFFVFLTDFADNLKKYIPLAAAHLLITLSIILVMPFGVTILEGDDFIKDRAIITVVAIMFFWFLYWSIIAYQFWKISKLIQNKVTARRMQMMSAGAIFAILPYLFTITAAALQNFTINFAGEIFALASGILFYAGFIAPGWLRRRLEK